jgi:hypothetical protein
MEQDLNFAKAEHPEERILLWVRLLPFSIGHKLLLHRICSPFMFGGKVSLNDLLDAILICSSDYRTAKRVMRGLKFKEKLWTWMVRFLCWKNPARIEQEIDEFEDYLSNSGEPKPRTWKVSGKTRETHVPEILNIKLTLLSSDCGFCESEIMDMPLVKARWFFEGYMDRKGAVQFIGPEEEDRLKRIREKQKGLFKCPNS